MEGQIPSSQIDQFQKLISNIGSLIISEDYRKKINDDKVSGRYNQDFLDVNNENPLESILIPILNLIDPKKKEIKTVDHVDLERYSGLWYEVARLPNNFENDSYNVKAEYKINNDSIEVTNTSIRRDGSINKVVGIAKSKDTTNSKLSVTFFWPFSGDYNIIRLYDNENSKVNIYDKDGKSNNENTRNNKNNENSKNNGNNRKYEYSVVSGNDNKYLWVLSRTPTMDSNKLSEILNSLGDEFDISSIIYTQHR